LVVAVVPGKRTAENAETLVAVLLALAASKVNRAIDMAFVERRNGTDRRRNARKARKTYRFSKRRWYRTEVPKADIHSAGRPRQGFHFRGEVRLGSVAQRRLPSG
jgi:hypothetical protein